MSCSKLSVDGVDSKSLCPFYLNFITNVIEMFICHHTTQPYNRLEPCAPHIVLLYVPLVPCTTQPVPCTTQPVPCTLQPVLYTTQLVPCASQLFYHVLPNFYHKPVNLYHTSLNVYHVPLFLYHCTTQPVTMTLSST